MSTWLALFVPRRHPAIVAVVGILLAALPAWSARSEVAVRAVNAKKVVVDAGLDRGLWPGKRLQVLRDGEVVAELGVVGADRDAASCLVFSRRGAIRVGDVVVLKTRATTQRTSTEGPSRPRSVAGPNGSGAGTQTPPRRTIARSVPVQLRRTQPGRIAVKSPAAAPDRRVAAARARPSQVEPTTAAARKGSTPAVAAPRRDGPATEPSRAPYAPSTLSGARGRPAPAPQRAPAARGVVSTSRPIRILEVAGNRVRIAAGSVQGLRAGRRLQVVRGRRFIAELGVVSVSRTAATCIIFEQRYPVRVSDGAVLKGPPSSPTGEPQTPASTKEVAAAPARAPSPPDLVPTPASGPAGEDRSDGSGANRAAELAEVEPPLTVSAAAAEKPSPAPREADRDTPPVAVASTAGASAPITPEAATESEAVPEKQGDDGDDSKARRRRKKSKRLPKKGRAGGVQLASTRSSTTVQAVPAPETTSLSSPTAQQASQPTRQESVPQAQTRQEGRFEVSYVSNSAVYLDGGREQGLEVGQRLQVVRGGDDVAQLEVAFVADHSASCRILSQVTAVEKGDEALVQGTLSIPTTARQATSTSSAETADLGMPSGGGTGSLKPIRSVPWAQLSGSVSVGWQQFEDDSAADRDFQETTARVSLGARDMGGTPYDLRLRMRSRQNRRIGSLGADSSRDQRSDRLYEMSLTYDPPDGRFFYQLGRLGASPALGSGYLDGILGRVKVVPRFFLGGFFGSRPEVEDLAFDSSGDKYGAFLGYTSRPADSRRFAEVILSGIGEYDDEGDVSREYLALETRVSSGGKWSLYQRGEIDLNRDWRQELADKAYQISNLSLLGSYRLSQALRLGISYDQRRRYRDEETRDIPEELFDDALREGLRASLYYGRHGWTASTSVGLRRQKGDDEPLLSLAGSLYSANLWHRSFLLGGDFSAYSGDSAEGYLVALRATKYFSGGHDLGLTLGTSSSSVTGIDEDRVNEWLRVLGTLRLPKRFFILGEIELDTGDDLEGHRIFLDLGHRF